MHHKVLRFLYPLWNRIAPPHSVRAQLPQLVRAWLFTLRREGVVAAWRFGFATLRSLWHGFVAFYIVRNRALLASLRPFSYAEWIKAYEPSKAELARQRAAAAGARQPTISIITPVYNPTPEVLADTIRSVLAQTYPAWELCLADGGSTLPGVHEVLQEFAQQDDRIKVRNLEENRGIAGNMNAALEMARGDYIALLDHDDLLAPHMLYTVAQRLQEDPQLDVVYFDEDKVAEDGVTRLQPWFKPDFSPDMLFSTNLLMHSVFRREMVVALGGFDGQMDGAQDWDLACRVAAETSRIAHVPQVLYHWRQVPGSAARDAAAKPWAFEAQLNCVRAHLERSGARQGDGGADVEFAGLGMVRVRWRTAGALVSIIIPTKNHRALLEACLSTLQAKTRYPNYEIILVDNGSSDADTLAYYTELAQDTRIRIIPFDATFNYSRANNLGAHHARGDYLLFLNNDTEIVDGDWLDDLVGWCELPEVGVVGAKLIRPDGTLQHAGMIMGLMGHSSHVFDGGPDHQYTYFGSTDWYRDYQSVTGACLMTKRAVFEAAGGFDEVYAIGFSDIEFCLRVRASGQRVVYSPFAEVLHKEGGSRGFFLPPADIVRATYQMLPQILPGDPYFSPNLSYQHRIPTLARPGGERREERLLAILRDFELASYASSSTLARWVEDAPVPVDWPALRAQATAPDRPRRVLLFTHDLSLSGAPLVMCMAGRGLQQLGYHVAVVSPLDGPLRALYTEVGVEVFVEAQALTDVRVAAPYLAQGWDAVLANTILSWRVIHAAHAFGQRVVWWLHEAGYGRDLVHDHRAVALALDVADVVLFPAQATAQLYAPWRHQENAVVQPYGLDLRLLDRIDAARPAKVAASPDVASAGKPLEADQAPVKVVHVGSIEPRKGQDVLVDALLQMPPDVRRRLDVALVGRVLDPVFRHKVETKAAGLSNVRFWGEAAHAETMTLLREADIFVLSSRDEVLPVTVLEAMYHAKAIVATDVGGIREMVRHGETGLVAPSEDAGLLMEHLARLSGDADLRRRLGQAAQADFLQRYQLDHLTTRLTTLIDELRERPWREDAAIDVPTATGAGD